MGPFIISMKAFKQSFDISHVEGKPVVRIQNFVTLKEYKFLSLVKG